MAMHDKGGPITVLDAKQETLESRSHAQPVRVQVLNSWQELEKRRKEWEHLLHDCASSSIFSTPEWLEAYWHAYGNGRETICPVFLGPENEIVGFVGLYSEWTKTLLVTKLRRLCFVGDGTYESVQLDLIAKRGYEQRCARSFVDWLSSQGEWDLCELNTLSDNSATLSALLSTLSARKWKYQTLSIPSSAIPLPDSWDMYLSQIPRKERSKVNRRTKEVENRFRVSFTKCTEEAELSAALNVLFDLHQRRWKQRGVLGTFSSAERRTFYREMALSFLRRGWLEFWQMTLDERPVASQFAFRHSNTVYVLQKGFDPEYLDLSVGYVLEAHVIRALISEGVSCYDYLGGGEFSKQRMGAQSGHYVSLRFARPFSKGALLLRMDELRQTIKARLYDHLPAAVLRLLKNTYSGFRGKRNSVPEHISE